MLRVARPCTVKELSIKLMVQWFYNENFFHAAVEKNLWKVKHMVWAYRINEWMNDRTTTMHST